MDVQETVAKAKQQSAIGGLFKYLYYISPIGYLFSYQKHVLCREITAKVWQQS